RWREPYPDEHLDRFEEMLDVATASGIDLAMTLSPGLDWRAGEDEAALVAKLRQLHDVGIRNLGVQWDDIAPGGADLGATHGRAVAAAVRGLPDDVRWMTVGVDYATAHATSYLRGFAAELPAEVSVAWTGPSITSPDVPAADAQRLADELDRPIFLGDNFPVNDLGMAPVLHLGPAPSRDPATRAVCAGVGFNFMSLPLASRIGLEVSARHWRDPGEDREAAWREVVGKVPGLTPLARACRSWLTDPGPDRELLSWVDAAFDGDDRLPDFLAAGCRDGLEPDWEQELEPWLTAWQWEALVMNFAVYLVRGEGRGAAMGLGDVWPRLHRLDQQVFGIRFAVYGVTWRDGDVQYPHPDTVVRGDNLTDVVLTRALERFGPPS
ncbi:MAG TPA: beta-N-acetylglucosaminidase domain-containing protein, partial [Nitriliruptorales bacterium]